MKKTQIIMETNKISVDEALKQIRAGNFNSNAEIIFSDEKIDAFDAILLGKNGIDVPEELIQYDDDKIDYSDIPPITDDDLTSGKIKWLHKAEFLIPKEVEDWLKEEKIDLNTLLSDLVVNFYKTIKNIQKNALYKK